MSDESWKFFGYTGLQNVWGNIVFFISVKELDVIVHKKIFSLYNTIKFWPFCTPPH